jgi:hypothetical protein
MRRCVRLALVACVASWAPASLAAQPLDLSWQAPPGCPQESAVREQLRALVPSAMLENGRLKAEGTITRIDKRYRLRLVLHLGDISGERSIDSDSCSDLAGAAAVALGLLLQSATQTTDKPGTAAGTSTPGTNDSHDSSSANAPPSATAPPTSTSTATDPDTNPSTNPPTDGTPRSWRVFIAPQLAVDLGPMPKPSVGVAVTAGLSVQQWRLIASFAFPQHQELLLAGASGAGAKLQHVAAEVWFCRAWRSDSLELAPCLLLGWERLQATGNGPGVEAWSEQASWVSGGVAAVGRWYVADWFAFAASVGAKVEGARPTISIEGLGDQGRLDPAAFSFRTGPVWIF